MFTVFISDLHLHHSCENITKKFLQFVQEIAPKADAVYILGDFFEVWIGDDAANDFQQSIIKALQSLSQTTPIYFMLGNRDFLLGSQFMEACHGQLLAEPYLLELYGKKLLLLHGDTLCLDDASYQRFRWFVRNTFIQRLFLLLPLAYRKKLAAKVRKVSNNKNTEICDISPSEVPRLLKHYQADFLIHGHTHRPAVNPINIEGSEATHIVLSDWGDRGNILYLHDDSRFELSYF